MVVGQSYIIKNTTNQRLMEMGVVKGIVVKCVKRVSGMIQLKLDNSDLVIREELLNEIEYKNK